MTIQKLTILLATGLLGALLAGCGRNAPQPHPGADTAGTPRDAQPTIHMIPDTPDRE